MKPVLPVGTVISYLGVKAVVIEDGPTEFLVVCEGNHESWWWECDGHTCEIVAYPSGSTNQPASTVQGEQPASDIAKALRSADWSGVSIGNKALIASAIGRLEAPAMNEPEKMKNAMQLAQGPMPTTLGELHDYLDNIRKAWSAQDTKYLGSYESQPLYILPNDPTPGFHLAKAKYFAEFGLTFIPVEGASK